MTIFYFAIGLGLLVLIHEWGHFIVARLCGIRVLKFSIGFGPKIIGFKYGETEYRISLIPLGGYVQLFGEDPSDPDLPPHAQDAFCNKPLPARVATVLAGPVMNLVLACLLMPASLMIGRMIPEFMDKPPVVMGVKENSPANEAGFLKGDRIVKIDAQPVAEWEEVLNWIVMHPEKKVVFEVEREGQKKELPILLGLSPETQQQMGYAGIEPFYFWGDDPIIGHVSAQSPAEAAGLKGQDKITAVNGNPVSSWSDMVDMVRKGDGKPLKMSVLRGVESLSVTVLPHYNQTAQAWQIGVTKFENLSLYHKKQYGFSEALTLGMIENIKLVKLTGYIVRQLFTFQLSYKALGGPVQIAQASAAAARSGFGDFFYFLAFLSLQLGVMNLLPIPVLDGGHLFFMGLEAIFRRPVSVQVRNVFNYTGLVFLLGLMLLVTANDIDTTWGWMNLWNKVRNFF